MFTELENTDLANRIANQVLMAIGDGRLRPGEKVGEARLARELGTSRAPVREALRLLESQGLIVTHPRRGFFVHAYEADELDEIYDLRECLELHAAGAAVERMTEADLDQLSGQVALMKRLAHEGQLGEQVEQDYAFHRMLCELGGNMRIVRLFDQIATQLRAGIALLGRVYDDPRELARAHDPLIEALAARDAERLRTELREHLEDARIHVVQLYRGNAG
ncbi:GntR family transcriptional regulator [Marinibacterium profundimaris]|uniref:GntR family transcriptional regulator n=1 Tax=Marinibacterium profundimaris TaxID=1679460 RepID=A0A225NCA0_9RHOB|nr:GntR family transcriptional regulator [Marinibacterium profundimaris]